MQNISKVFLRFFLSFLLILFIPILVLGIISKNTIQSLLEKQVIENRTHILEQCASRIDYELDNVSSIVFKASEESQFSPYVVSDFNKNSLSIMSSLKTYRTANNFIQEIYLISDFSEYVYASSTSYTYSRFIEQKFPTMNTKEDLLAYLSETTENHPLGYTQTSDKQTLYLIRSVPSNSPYSYGYLIFEVRNKALDDFLFISHIENENILLFQDNHLIASSSDVNSSMETELENFLSQTTISLPSSGLFNEHYMLLSKYSDSSLDIVYCYLLPETQIIQEINTIIRNFILYLILILFWGTLSIFFLTHINYRPLKKVFQNALELLDGDVYSKSNDEFYDLSKIIEKTHQELEVSKSFRQYSFLRSLINGVSYTPEELSKHLEQTQLQFNGTRYFVVVFHISSPYTPEDIDTITDSIQNYQLQKISGYSANLYGSNIVGIYSCQPEDLPQISVQFLQLHQTLERELHTINTIGIGNPKDTLLEIASSFLEATTALDYRFVLGKNKLIFFKDLNLDVYEPIDFPQSLTDNLCLAIQSGKKQNADAHISALFDYLKNNSCSMYLTKSLCYDIINSVLKTIQSLKKTYDDLELTSLITLTKFETLEELEQMLHSFCSTICDSINENSPVSQPLITLALHYIHHNFSSPDFSIGKMAEDLNVSSSHLSRTFKEQQGITLTNYIKLYKITLAKKFLIETDDSIEKIVHMLGYYDTSSFIRMFKKSEGITPGEYRNQYQNQQN